MDRAEAAPPPVEMGAFAATARPVRTEHETEKSFGPAIAAAIS